jgi:16S rRNA (guanine527-N7)-methyltransferase
MTEAEARDWISSLDVPRETLARLERFIAFLVHESGQQNLIAASTIPTVWSRHIVDSAQLLAHAPAQSGRWIDFGSGPGFPGLIVAALSGWPVDLVESRAKRIQFLQEAIEILQLQSAVRVFPSRAEKLEPSIYEVISARAFAPLPRLFELGRPFADGNTSWLLPKGRNAAAEVAEAGKTWQGSFELVPSVTDADSSILIARGVRSSGERR